MSDNMGTCHAYGNLETYEYIKLGVGGPSVWTDLFYGLIRGEIEVSSIKSWLLENFKVNHVPDGYIEWVADNVTKFVERAKTNLILKNDDLVSFYDEKIKICDEIEPYPPFYFSSTLIGGKENPWKEVWNRYADKPEDMIAKNL
jgi:hypothetical protein